MKVPKEFVRNADTARRSSEEMAASYGRSQQAFQLANLPHRRDRPVEIEEMHVVSTLEYKIAIPGTMGAQIVVGRHKGRLKA